MRALGSALAITSVLVGCNQIFGIEEGNLVQDKPIVGDDGGADAPELPDGQVTPDGSQPDVGPQATTIVDLALGDTSTCVALSTGIVKCWGDNTNGQLGDGTTNASAVPVTVAKITTAKALASGVGHVCALLADSSVWCWGADGHTQVGVTNSNACNCLPSATNAGLVAGTTLGIGAGSYISFAVRDKLYRWGGWGGGGASTNSPTAFTTLPDKAEEAHGGDSHACYRAAGTIRCWGLYNANGELGIGNTTSNGPLYDPGAGTPVVAVTTFAQFSAASDGTCGVTTAGDVYCWGSNQWGKLGVPSTSSQTPLCAGSRPCTPTPIKVDLGANVKAKQVSLGNSTTCALITDGSVKCWGTNTYGEMGTATGAGVVDQPPMATDISDVVLLALGGRHACAVLSDKKTLKCWGWNKAGELGYSTSPADNSVVPTSVVY